MRLIVKAKRMPIGTISHGRKKMAEGKWVPLPKGYRPPTAIEETYGKRTMEQAAKFGVSPKMVLMSSLHSPVEEMSTKERVIYDSLAVERGRVTEALSLLDDGISEDFLKWVGKLGVDNLGTSNAVIIAFAIDNNMSLKESYDILKEEYEKEKEEKQQEYPEPYEDDEEEFGRMRDINKTVDGIHWDSEEFMIVAEWCAGDAVTELRNAVRWGIDDVPPSPHKKDVSYSASGERYASEYFSPIGLEAAERLLGQFKKKTYEGLSRFTNNSLWLEAEIGTEVPLGIASFSHEKRESLSAGGAILRLINMPNDGVESIDILAMHEASMENDFEARGANYRSEMEVIVRSPYLRIAARKGNVVYVELAMPRTEKSKKLSKADIEKLYDDLSKPLSPRPKKRKMRLVWKKQVS